MIVEAAEPLSSTIGVIWPPKTGWNVTEPAEPPLNHYFFGSQTTNLDELTTLNSRPKGNLFFYIDIVILAIHFKWAGKEKKESIASGAVSRSNSIVSKRELKNSYNMLSQTSVTSLSSVDHDWQ